MTLRTTTKEIAMRRLSVLLSVVVFIAISAIIVVIVPTVAQDATPTSDLEANKALARRFHDEIFDQGNLAPPTRS